MSEASDIEQMIQDAKAFAADPKPLLPEMVEYLGIKAASIEASQRGWLAGGVYSEPDHRAMREVVVLDAIHSFLEACIQRPGEVARRLNNQRR